MIVSAQQKRRLPGVNFETQTALREEVLPRMDVAVFVGFAASGPIGLPVVLESEGDFIEIFGRDLPLVRDKKKGETVYAYLWPTVRTFFQNGGKRCWVIRLARKTAKESNPINRATYNYFPLKGIGCLTFNKTGVKVVPAIAQARSEGSWSDNLQVNVSIISQNVRFLKLMEDSENREIDVRVSSSEEIQSGEMLRVDYFEEDRILYLTVDEVEVRAKETSTLTGNREYRIFSKNYVWAERLNEKNTNSIKNAKSVSVKIWKEQKHLTATASPRLFGETKTAKFSLINPKNSEQTAIKIKLIFSAEEVESLETGDWVGLTYRTREYCLQVEKTFLVENENEEKFLEVICQGMICRKKLAEPESKPRAERLKFEIQVKRDKTSLERLSELDFNEGGQRFWGDIPLDRKLFSFSEDEQKEIKQWTREPEAFRFPLAGNSTQKGFFLPIFLEAETENFSSSMEMQGSKLERNGLAEFDVDLFLDSQLKNVGLSNLLNEAEFISYLSQNPRRLRGIHGVLTPETLVNTITEGSPTKPIYSSLSLEEATIISVPDALHRGWYLEKDQPVSPPLSVPPFPTPIRPEWWRFLDCHDLNPKFEPVKEPKRENFLDCRIKVISAPTNLKAEDDITSGEDFLLSWENTETLISSENEKEKIKFVLEESTSLDFIPSTVIYCGEDTKFKVSGKNPGDYFYRVKAVVGRNYSDWSEGEAVHIPILESWVLNPVEDYTPEVLMAVYRSLLRVCSARGDVFAVLTLPEHYEKDEAINFVGRLRGTTQETNSSFGVAPLNADEKSALSFGAVYHPWIVTKEKDFESNGIIPPNGAVCGVISQRSRNRGAWVAPANEVFREVVALNRKFPLNSFLDFQDNLINLLRQEANGFLVFSAETLSENYDLRQINVRRLMSLLRRLAIKHGAEYVFEANNESFRRQVQRGFNSLLNGMFVKGAFAGATPATSYQVVVSDSINTPQSTAEGRFIVEIKVAPSLPLRFITVRLVQTGGKSQTTETFS